MKMMNSKSKKKCDTCQVRIPSSMLNEHKMAHSMFNVVNIERCKLCSELVENYGVESAMEHMINRHQSKAQCCFCKLEFSDFDELFYHLKRSFKEVIHCGKSDCTFTTLSCERMSIHCRSQKHSIKRISWEYVAKCFYEKLDLEVDTFEFKAPKIPIGNKRMIMDTITTQRRSYMVNKDTEYSPDHHSNKENTVTNEMVPGDHPLRYIGRGKRAKILKIGFSNPTRIYMESLDYCLDQFNAYFRGVSDEEREMLLDKLNMYKKHNVLITQYGEVRTYSCVSCDFKHRNGYSDIRRHIMGIHCKVPKKFVANLMKSANISQPKKETSLSSSEETSGGDQVKLEESVEPKNKARKLSSIIVPFRYSEKVFRVVCRLENNSESQIDEYVSKMNVFTQCGVRISRSDSLEVLAYECTECEFKEISFEDVMKHCLLEHAGFSNFSSTVQKIAFSTGKSDRSYQLLSDDILMNIKQTTIAGR